MARASIGLAAGMAMYELTEAACDISKTSLRRGKSANTSAVVASLGDNRNCSYAIGKETRLACGGDGTIALKKNSANRIPGCEPKKGNSHQ